MRLFGTMDSNERGNLTIGGCDATNLAMEYGTPLYVVDEELVRKNCELFKNSFKSEGVETEVIYASKAFLNLAMCKLINEEELSMDVVSGGELFTALKSGFPMEKIFMHGNNKTEDELRLAIECNVGRIIVDNKEELALIEDICKSLNKSVNVLLRVNPGVEAHTHEFIQTANNDSKFGESIFSKDIFEIIKLFIKSENVNLMGFHCHIGSQIFDKEAFYQSVSVMIKFINDIKMNCDYITRELNMGGGFGVYYFQGDSPMEFSSFLGEFLEKIKVESQKYNLKVPKMYIEPGRAIIANAGTTLYKVGGIKETFGGRKYVFVDGGMSDNIRTALYDAKYEAVVSNKLKIDNSETYTIAGKCCESGDIIVKDVMLPKVERNDIIAVLSTGAYNYSMASNYNRIPRPAVVFVKNGEAKLAVKKESYEDLIRNDVLV